MTPTDIFADVGLTADEIREFGKRYEISISDPTGNISPQMEEIVRGLIKEMFHKPKPPNEQAYDRAMGIL